MTQAKQPVRRVGSIKKIAQRWRITEAAAAEIAGNVESAQTYGDDTGAAPGMSGLDVTTDPRRTFVCRRDTLDLVFQMPLDHGSPVAAISGDCPPTGLGLPTMFALMHRSKASQTTPV